MNPEVVLQGRLNPDGTLDLNAKPALPVGAVEVTIRSLVQPQVASEDWWQYLQRARSELEAAGHRFRTKEEIDSEIEHLRSDDDRVEGICHRMDKRA